MLQGVVATPVERTAGQREAPGWLHFPQVSLEQRSFLFRKQRNNISKQSLFVVLVPNFLESELYDENLKNIYWTTEKEQLEAAVHAPQRLAGKKLLMLMRIFFSTKEDFSVCQEHVYKRANTDFTFEIQSTLLSPYVLEWKSKYLKAN